MTCKPVFCRIPLEIIEPHHQGFQAGGGVHPLVQIQASFSAIKGNGQYLRRFPGKLYLYCLLPPYSQHLTEQSSLILAGYPVSKSGRFRSVRRVGRNRNPSQKKRRTEALLKPQVESAAPYRRSPSGLPIVPQRCGNENGPFRPCHYECAGTPSL